MENTNFAGSQIQNSTMQTDTIQNPSINEQSPIAGQNPLNTEEKKEESPLLQFMKTHFLWFGGTACLYAFLYTFCLYDNPAGITYPVAVAVTILFSILWLGKAGINIKREAFFYFAGMLLLGISTCMTANRQIHLFNTTGILLLFCAAMLHQMYEDRCWNFSVYMKQMLIFMGTCMISLFKPFEHALYYFSQKKTIRKPDEKKQASAILAGFAIAGLFLLCVMPLLITSDQVFAKYLINCFSFPDIGADIELIFCFFTGFLLLYVFFAALFRQNLKEAGKSEEHPANALTGITFTAILAFIYIIYSGIQVIFLFLRRGLPDGMSYAQYAHQGFWQLLIVSLINIATVLVCIQIFEKHPALKILLLIISLCTCIMTVSAAYRMILYINIYHLTFLRILVLWFLSVLTLMMGGIMVSIFRERFHLFQYIVIVVTCCYIVFSFARVDGLIASYNIRHTSQITWQDVSYFLYALSEDAAPYMEELAEIEIEKYLLTEEDHYYYRDIPYESTTQEDLKEFKTVGDYLGPLFQAYMEDIADGGIPSLRKWNFAQARAREAAEAYLKKH